ncbi:protein TIC 22, chloroplastic-like isoform X8 [Lycium barbarum]|uniref:protein TIC 22, chloroplastic-like isoform X8 n=1 Tax=Lycium barbarum TaxID=112863 RepID=UPI00293F41D1|nr:protein TIC 22, chloroplastic-like isoform X8 [Lycium barbarum]
MVLVMEKIFFWCSSRLIGGKSDKLLVIYFYVYMLKVEGIAFRFLPDPVQIKNAMELKASDVKTGFDGVPVFQSSAKVQDEEDMKNWPWPFQV